jgi:hypothetical protein
MEVLVPNVRHNRCANAERGVAFVHASLMALLVIAMPPPSRSQEVRKAILIFGSRNVCNLLEILQGNLTCKTHFHIGHYICSNSIRFLFGPGD